ncbi:MAG: insulinase family protein, partial [Oligoflexales bacterium]|nr:insulinase family protein [Oligoflexales bacterium]
MLITSHRILNMIIRKKIPCLITAAILVFQIRTSPLSAKENKNQQGESSPESHGFKLIRKKEIREIESCAKLFFHTQSGATLMKIENSDDNKAFSVGFRTLPQNNAGVAHIIEHSIMSGSKNFPAKNLLNILLKGSHSTFINAITWRDHTAYPIASCNMKEFKNLMHIYLDLVFYPRFLSDPLVFMQEGWHHEYDEKSGLLRYNGVVYNEMKGVDSNPGQRLYNHIGSTMLKGSAQAVNSGGDPDMIPTLTFEDLKNFHSRFYHPDNSYIYLYGNGDTNDELKFIASEYLDRFADRKKRVELPKRLGWKGSGETAIHYPILKDESESDKTILNLAFLFPEGYNQEIEYAFSIIADFLINNSAAPLKRHLVENSIGKAFGAYLSGGDQPYFNITAENANIGDGRKFRELVIQFLKKNVATGFEKEIVEGILNTHEIRIREHRMGSARRGIDLAFETMNAWLYAGDPFRAFDSDKYIRMMRRGLGNRYFEKLVERFLLQGQATLLTEVRPKKGMADEIDKRRENDILKTDSSLSAGQKKNILDNHKALKDYETKPVTQDELAMIPFLNPRDMDPSVKKYPHRESMIQGVRTVFYPQGKGQIAYLRLFFDTSFISEADIPYVSLLYSLLGHMDTKRRSYQDLEKEISIHTGGISIFAQIYSKDGNLDIIYPKLGAKGKSLLDKFGKLTEITAEILMETRFTDKKRLKILIEELNADMLNRMRSGDDSYALTRLRSRMSPYGLYQERILGVAYLE